MVGVDRRATLLEMSDQISAVVIPLLSNMDACAPSTLQVQIATFTYFVVVFIL